MIGRWAAPAAREAAAPRMMGQELPKRRGNTEDDADTPASRAIKETRMDAASGSSGSGRLLDSEIIKALIKDITNPEDIRDLYGTNYITFLVSSENKASTDMKAMGIP
mmetsp:Transcript_152645/g.489549  ORF Transcript_152645/g.489549 Transcript_152645/m.489549 type:complete len:108 (+) Transcript_152645:611-934(+)